MPVLFQFLALLAVHWLADFVLQTHWQASNKSKNNEALARHVGVYTLTLAVGSTFILGQSAAWVYFVLVNGVLHFSTDYFTSRWSSRHFARAAQDTARVIQFTQAYNQPPNATDMRLMEVDPGRHWHNFFVVIGLDQLIHQVTLAVTLWVILK